MRILISGICGFAGSAIARAIAEAGGQVLVVNPTAKGQAALTSSHLPAGDYRCTRWQVVYVNYDAYTAYFKINAPQQLTRAQEEALRKAAAGEPEAQTDIRIDGTFTQTLPLRDNDVILLTLTRR